MVNYNELNFSTTLGVLYTLKERCGFTTLQESYKYLENTDIDVIINVLCISYNKANKTNYTNETFMEFLSEEKELGFVQIMNIYKQVVEKMVFGGMTPEEVESQKNFMMNLK